METSPDRFDRLSDLLSNTKPIETKRGVNVLDAPDITLKEDKSGKEKQHFLEYRLPGSKWCGEVMSPEWNEFYLAQLEEQLGKRPENAIDGEKYTTEYKDTRYRCQLTNNRKGWAIAMRKINKYRADYRQLNLSPEIIQNLSSTGLYIVGGPNGNGKTATLQAMVDAVEDRGKMLDIGDPIEYIRNEPFVDQREVGEDVSSMEVALYEAVRGCYDTVIIGEIRDPETAKAAVLCGQSGALVFATLHAENVQSALGRMENFLPDSYKPLLPHVLKYAMVQYLEPVNSDRTEHGKALIPVYETLRMSGNVRNLMADGGAKALTNMPMTQQSQGAITFEKCLEAHRTKHLMSEDEYVRGMKRYQAIAKIAG